jgi:acyl-coenzyme A thioesterase 13
MTHSRIESLKTLIGQPMTRNPSPVARWLDGRFKAVSEGSLSVEFTVREEMTNPMGILHGGIAATMLDEVLGATVYSLGHEHFFVSVNLNVDYLSSARIGEVVTAQSQVVRKGRNIVHAECRLTNAEGKLLVKAITNMLATGTKIPNGRPA